MKANSSDDEDEIQQRNKYKRNHQPPAKIESADDDDEEDSRVTHDKKDRPLSKHEQEKIELESTPAIPLSEVSPAAFIFTPTEQEQQSIVFEEKSQKVKCPHCDSVSHSIVAYETNLLGYLLAVFAILIFGILSIFIMPFLVGLTKQAVHKCAKCLNDVKQANLFGLNSLEDKVIAKQCGRFGIIVTRRQLLYLALVASTVLGIYMFILAEDKYLASHQDISTLSW